MPLIFGDDRFDFGKLPDLMSQRLDIDAGEWFATTGGHASGTQEMTWRHSSGGIRGRFVRFSWPGWPPRTFAIGVCGILGILGSWGLSCADAMRKWGFDEFREFLPSLASNSVTCAVKRSICVSCQRTNATTAGGVPPILHPEVGPGHPRQPVRIPKALLSGQTQPVNDYLPWASGAGMDGSHISGVMVTLAMLAVS